MPPKDSSESVGGGTEALPVPAQDATVVMGIVLLENSSQPQGSSSHGLLDDCMFLLQRAEAV